MVPFYRLPALSYKLPFSALSDSRASALEDTKSGRQSGGLNTVDIRQTFSFVSLKEAMLGLGLSSTEDSLSANASYQLQNLLPELTSEVFHPGDSIYFTSSERRRGFVSLRFNLYLL